MSPLLDKVLRKMPLAISLNFSLYFIMEMHPSGNIQSVAFQEERSGWGSASSVDK